LFDMLAYIDPGAGSLIVQAIIGTLVAVPYLLRRQLARVLRSLGGGRWTTSGEAAEPSEGAGIADER
jgi:hypothetical protein